VEAAREVGFDEAEQRQISLAVHECMVNAVAPGNRFQPTRKVHFRILYSQKLFSHPLIFPLPGAADKRSR